MLVTFLPTSSLTYFKWSYYLIFNISVAVSNFCHKQSIRLHNNLRYLQKQGAVFCKQDGHATVYIGYKCAYPSYLSYQQIQRELLDSTQADIVFFSKPKPKEIVVSNISL